MPKTVVVTGGTGFIGSFLVEELLQSGVTVRVPFRKEKGYLNTIDDQIEWMQGDLCDAAFCTELLTGADQLMHLAAYRKNIDEHHKHKEEIIAQNVFVTENLIGAVPPQCTVTFFSTALVGTVDDSFNSKDGYIAAKARCEKLWKEATSDLLIVRPINVYGPRDYFGIDGNVVPALMKKASQEAETLTVWGSGKQERAFLYAPDLAKATMVLLEHAVTGTVYIVPSEVMPIKDLAQKIVEIVHPSLTLAFDTTKQEGILTMPDFPVHPLLSTFSWTPLSEGLQDTFDWYQSSLH